MDYRIIPPEEMIEATVSVPLSKSISNRVLIINALTPGAKPVGEVAHCDDSEALIEALNAIAGGASCVDVGAAGTAMRFLTAYVAATPGSDVVVDGSARMRRRPMSALIEALRALGADIECTGEEGHAPLHIRGRRLSGGDITIDATISSQFISALMMVAPTMERPLNVTFDGEVVSMPYLRMTAALMERAGIAVDLAPYSLSITPGTYKPTQWHVEADWSAASYWYELTALSAGWITVEGLQTDSIQGDARCMKYFERLGVMTNESDEVEGALELSASPDNYSRFEEDLIETPDLAPTLAVTSAMLGIPFHLRGLQSLRVKETDRLQALKAEFDKFGFVVEIRNDSELVWNLERHPIFELPVIDTYDDHRMAMAFAPAALYVPGMVIRDVEVVSKSYPDFWDNLRRAGFIVVDASEPLPEAEGDDE